MKGKKTHPHLTEILWTLPSKEGKYVLTMDWLEGGFGDITRT
jgi:hypothetical protein